MKNLTLKITKTNKEGEYKVSVYTDTGIGPYEGTFVNPISKDKLNEQLVEHGLAIRSSEDVRARGNQAVISPEAKEVLKDFGTQLFKSLFKDLVLRAYDRVSTIESGLRVRIAPYIRMTEYAEIMNLPWEFLYDDFDMNYIAVSRNITIVRTPQEPIPIDPLVLKSPLKVLAIASKPSGSGLELEEEMISLTNMFTDEKIPIIKSVFLKPPTIKELDKKLHDEEYHILHFMGHGTFIESTGESALAFEDIKGEEDKVTGSRLRSALTPSIKLVFLNACETARIGEANPFAAISTELIQAGVPAVLAMQFSISNAAAIEFSRTFYSHIAEGFPVDQAVSEGRRMLRLDQNIGNEWGTPVLFMRSADGMIFKMEQESQQKGRKVVVAEKKART